MALMNYSVPVKSFWKKHGIQPLSKTISLDFNSKVIILDLPAGKMIEIVWDKKKFQFSSDSVKYGAEDSNVGKYLEKFIYPKLQKIIDELKNQEMHFYGYISKIGFVGIDIYVNENWLNWDLSESFFMSANIKAPKIIMIGFLNNFEYNNYDNFICR